MADQCLRNSLSEIDSAQTGNPREKAEGNHPDPIQLRTIEKYSELTDMRFMIDTLFEQRGP